MVKITANGPYILDSDSAGTYHELVAGVTGTASCKALVRMKRQPMTAQTWPLYSCVPSGTAIAHVKVG